MTELFNKFDDDDDDFNGQIADVSRHWKIFRVEFLFLN